MPGCVKTGTSKQSEAKSRSTTFLCRQANQVGLLALRATLKELRTKTWNSASRNFKKVSSSLLYHVYRENRD